MTASSEEYRVLKTEDKNPFVNWFANNLVCKMSESSWKLPSEFPRALFNLAISSKHYQFTVNIRLIDQAQFVIQLLFLLLQFY